MRRGVFCLLLNAILRIKLRRSRVNYTTAEPYSQKSHRPVYTDPLIISIVVAYSRTRRVMLQPVYWMGLVERSRWKDSLKSVRGRSGWAQR